MQSEHLSAMSARLCEVCGLDLPRSTGRGRPRRVHAGSCTRTRKSEKDEQTRQARYEAALVDGAARARGLTASPGDVDTDGEGESTVGRLAEAGFRGHYDDATEGLPRVPGLPVIGGLGDLKEAPRFGPVPKAERGFTQNRRAVLASLRPTFAEEARRRSAPDCLGCAAFDYLLVTTVTAESLIRGRAEARQDGRVRRYLTEDDLGALMTHRPH